MRYLILSLSLALCSCASVTPRQVALRRLSAGALAACKRDRAACERVQPCQGAALDAARDLQLLARDRAEGKPTEMSELVSVISEAAAQRICADVGVRP